MAVADHNRVSYESVDLVVVSIVHNNNRRRVNADVNVYETGIDLKNEYKQKSKQTAIQIERAIQFTRKMFFLSWRQYRQIIRVRAVVVSLHFLKICRKICRSKQNL